SFAVYLLKRHQINRLTLTQYLSHGTRKDEVQVEEEVEDIEGDIDFLLLNKMNLNDIILINNLQ
ncbi:hypothetical protein ECD93_17840, partial [Acinetobacter baumannii]|nr:hypothetical protein [Acinetobacter baumannii]